jgi:hypothetical protein
MLVELDALSGSAARASKLLNLPEPICVEVKPLFGAPSLVRDGQISWVRAPLDQRVMHCRIAPRRHAKIDQPAGSSYVNTTPTTVPVVALPTAKTPDCESVIPMGNAAPPGEMPNVPPLTTSYGRICVKSHVAPLPTIKNRGPVSHDSYDLYVGACSVPPPPHPSSSVAHPDRLNANALRRVNLLMGRQE